MIIISHPTRGRGIFLKYFILFLPVSLNTEVVTLAEKLCQPYPSIVKVEEPGIQGRFYWPSFVELHRCVGGCFVISSKWVRNSMLGYHNVSERLHGNQTQGRGKSPKGREKFDKFLLTIFRRVFPSTFLLFPGLTICPWVYGVSCKPNYLKTVN